MPRDGCKLPPEFGSQVPQGVLEREGLNRSRVQLPVASMALPEPGKVGIGGAPS